MQNPHGGSAHLSQFLSFAHTADTPNARRVVADQGSHRPSMGARNMRGNVGAEHKFNPEAFVKHSMTELKKQLSYIDQTNWYFQSDAIDFTLANPFMN